MSVKTNNFQWYLCAWVLIRLKTGFVPLIFNCMYSMHRPESYFVYRVKNHEYVHGTQPYLFQ